MTDTKGVPIRRLNPPELGSPPGYSQIVEVRASRIVFIAGQTALDRDGALVGKNDFAAQAEQVFRNLGIALETPSTHCARALPRAAWSMSASAEQSRGRSIRC